MSFHMVNFPDLTSGPTRETTRSHPQQAVNSVNTFLPSLPGISYIPDQMELSEDPKTKRKIMAEFIDFINCVTDLLQLVDVVTDRHLLSLKPMPGDVVREILAFRTSTGCRTKAYYRSLCVAVTPIQSKAKVNKRDTPKTSFPKVTVLQDIVGKKKKPLWHLVLKQIMRDPRQDISIKSSDKADIHHRKPKQNALPPSSKNSLPTFYTKSQLCMRKINAGREVDVQPRNHRYSKQMDMLSAYFRGLTTLKEYHDFMETQRPHWLTDLLKRVRSFGLLNCQEMVTAFERLGKFFEYRDIKGKAKLCFIIQSIPMWDVARITVQRATEFILQEIFKEPDPDHTLVEWLKYRELPYVVMPPLGAYRHVEEEEEKAEDEGEEGEGKGENGNIKSRAESQPNSGSSVNLQLPPVTGGPNGVFVGQQNGLQNGL